MVTSSSSSGPITMPASSMTVGSTSTGQPTLSARAMPSEGRAETSWPSMTSVAKKTFFDEAINPHDSEGVVETRQECRHEVVGQWGRGGSMPCCT